MNQSDIRELPKLVCPNCQMLMTFGASTQNPRQQTKRGDLFVCCRCGAVSQVGDSNLVKLTKDDLEKLDRQTQVNLAAAVAVVTQQQAGQSPIALN